MIFQIKVLSRLEIIMSSECHFNEVRLQNNRMLSTRHGVAVNNVVKEQMEGEKCFQFFHTEMKFARRLLKVERRREKIELNNFL